MAKRLDSRYEPGRRTGAWVKIKHTRRQELVIAGWLPGEGRRTDRIGALLMGVYDEDGRAALRRTRRDRFTDRTLAQLRRTPARRCAADDRPFDARAQAAAQRRVREARAGGRDRVPRVDARGRDARAVVQGPARGQAARECRRARGVGRPASIQLLPRACSTRSSASPTGRCRLSSTAARSSSPTGTRCCIPQTGFTKGDLIAYYARIAPAVLPAPARPAADAQALSQRRRRAVLLREAVAVAPAGMGADRAHRRRRLHAGPGPRDARLAGQPRRHRAAHLAGARLGRPSGRRCWSSTWTPDRRRGSSSAARWRSCCAGCSARSDWRAWSRPRALRACRCTCRSTAEVTYEQTKPFAAPGRRAARAAPARARRLPHDQAAARGQGLRRLEPERRPQDDGHGLLGSRPGTAHGLDAGQLGGGPGLPRRAETRKS